MIPTNDVAIHFPTGTRITDITMEFVGGQHKNINVQAFYDVCRLVSKLTNHLISLSTQFASLIST